MNREWLTSPYGFLIFICLGYLANTTALAVADAWAFVRWLKQRRSRPDLACRTPGRMIQRLSGRTSHHAQGPIMPSEDEIKRYGRPDYGAPYVEPSPARPGPVRTKPDRRGLVAGVVALAVLLVAGVAAGAYFLGQRSTASSTPTKAAAQDLSGNAGGCRQFDKAFARIHAALTDASPYPAAIWFAAEDVRDKVPTAAGLTTGETRAAMLKVATYGKLLAAHADHMLEAGNLDDATEISGLKESYAAVNPLCARAGVTLQNGV